MAVEIRIPALGEGIESGDVLEIFVKVGDVIRKDDGVVELETDKATVTVPASGGGKVTKILVAVGNTVKIGQAVVEIEPAEGLAASTSQPAAGPASTADKPGPKQVSGFVAPRPVAPVPEKPSLPAQVPVPSLQSRTPLETVPTLTPMAVEVTPAADGSLVSAGPAMRRFARELGVNLATVQGTGDHGRITRDDIVEIVRSGHFRSTSAAPTTASAGISSPAVPSVAAAPVASASDSFGPVRLEKLSRIRQTIAQKMHESSSTVPRVTNFDDADVTDLEQIRQNNKKDYEARGIKLTTMPFLIKAVAMALRTHPVINASIDMQAGQIVYKEYVHVGIAVDSDRGLVVPALRNADKLGIPDIARALSEITERVRTGSFGVEDLRGGTFTISNLGAIGGTYSTPIINVPETAILLLGRSRKMPVVVGDDIRVRLMMPLSLSYDHRLIDGAAAARFLNDVIGYLEAPSRLLLAL